MRVCPLAKVQTAAARGFAWGHWSRVRIKLASENNSFALCPVFARVAPNSQAGQGLYVINAFFKSVSRTRELNSKPWQALLADTPTSQTAITQQEARAVLEARPA
jgi:hypothetical protein